MRAIVLVMSLMATVVSRSVVMLDDFVNGRFVVLDDLMETRLVVLNHFMDGGFVMLDHFVDLFSVVLAKQMFVKESVMHGRDVD